MEISNSSVLAKAIPIFNASLLIARPTHFFGKVKEIPESLVKKQVL